MFHLALFIQTIIVYANPKEHPEEWFEIVHERIRLTRKRTNSHKNLGSGLAGCARRLVIPGLNRKIQIDQEAIVFVSKQDVSNRYVTVEDSGIE